MAPKANLDEVQAVALAAIEAGRSPYNAVMDRFSVSRNTVDRYFSALRQAGRLPPPARNPDAMQRVAAALGVDETALREAIVTNTTDGYLRVWKHNGQPNLMPRSR